MKQALIYSLKVWGTTIGFAFMALVAMFVHHFLTKPPIHHGADEADPFFGTILFFIFNLSLIPAWGIFLYFVTLITRKLKYERGRIALNAIGVILILATFSPLFITHAGDETYYPIAGCYLVFISISVWLYKLKPFSNEPLPIISRE